MEESLVRRADIDYTGVATGKLRGANPVKIAKTAAALAQGVRQSSALLGDFKPDVCFVTGGYVCAPVVAACSLKKIPVIIYLPDMTPGWTINWMSKVAQRVAVSFPEVAPHFGGLAPQGKAVVTGYPVREDLVKWASDRPGARRRLAQALERPSLEERGVPLVLVWGGSQGARVINQAMWAALPLVLPQAHVLHVVGTRDWPIYQTQAAELAAASGDRFSDRYHPVAYLHDEMTLALAGADLSVARAGASILGEFPVAHLPSVLAPLVGVNQNANAELLANQGGAVIVADEALPRQLAPTLQMLLQDPARRFAMEDALRKLARPQAALAIAQEIVALAQQNAQQSAHGPSQSPLQGNGAAAS
jgi:UDP-N-acetylglucosamine--N-acetylmuramyl-(pentapeptide) pyrophosphoryl-undecaprenol N-acetylglucosamine transferase